MKIIYKTSAAFSITVLVACGGGGGGVSTETTTAITASYPEGVSASSPTAVTASSSTTITASVNIPPNQKFANWIDTLVAAVINHNSAQFIHTLQAALPFGDAIAAPTKVPEGKLISAYISEIASGAKIPTVTNMGFESFFKSYVKADCFGPSVAYTLHDDFVSGANQNGTLPSGDL